MKFTDTSLIYSQSDNNIIVISNNDKVLFKIDSDGNISYTLNGELKTMNSEKELALIFSLALCELSGSVITTSENIKEEIITKIIKNYREGKINLLLS